MEPTRRAALTAKCLLKGGCRRQGRAGRRRPPPVPDPTRSATGHSAAELHMDPAQKLWVAVRSHVRAFYRDLTDRSLLPMKLLYFMELAGIVTIWPHITTHMQHLRLTTEETGLIVMLGGVAGIVAALSAGFIGDKLGNFKVYLGFALLLEGLAGVLLAILPPALVDVEPSGVASLNHQCVDEFLHVRWQDERCEPHAGLATLNVTLTGCMLSCQPENASDPLLGGVFCNPGDDRCSVIFPGPSLLPASPLSMLLHNSSNSSSVLRVVSEEGGGAARPISCPAAVSSCSLSCSEGVPRAAVCAPEVSASGHTFTLGMYILLRVVYSFCLGTTYTLIDTAVLATCAQRGVDYGFQRLWGTLAALVVSPVAGTVMDALSTDGEINFAPGFYMQGCFRLFSLIVLFFVDIGFRSKPEESLLKKTWEMLKNVNLSVLFLVLLLTGMVIGHIETFTYVHLSLIGAGRTLIGATITVGSGVELLAMAVSGLCMRWFGHASLIVFGIVLNSIRLIGYWLIQDPVYSLLLEMLDGVTGGLMNTAAVTYAASMVPPELVSTVRGILGCFLFSGGRAVGAQLGGYVVHHLGHRQSFLVFALAALATAVFYAVFLLIRRQRRCRKMRLPPCVGKTGQLNGVPNGAV